MSADNWRPCPQCLAIAKCRAQVAKELADAAYGVKTLEEFDALRKRAGELEKVATGIEDGDGDFSDQGATSLREDYGFSTDTDGQFEARYRAACNFCGYTVTFDHSALFKPEVDVKRIREEETERSSPTGRRARRRKRVAQGTDPD